MHIWHYVSESIGMLQGLAVLFPEDEMILDKFLWTTCFRSWCS